METIDEHFDRMVREMYAACATYLRESGEVPEGQLIKAARAVVWARYYTGDIEEAIDNLEQIVGRPKDEKDI
jgi:hypothetical protein